MLQDLIHSLLFFGVGAVAGGLIVGFGVLGGMLRESERLTRAVGALVIQETGKLRDR
jgi:hypothetical protein